MQIAISKFADKFKLKFKSLFYAQGRTPYNPLNTLILEMPRSRIFIQTIFGDFGDFLSRFS